MKFIAVLFVFIEKKGSDEHDATAKERYGGKCEEKEYLISTHATDLCDEGKEDALFLSLLLNFLGFDVI